MKTKEKLQPIEYYVYSTPCVYIKWNGKIQPIKPFKSAIEAKQHIENTYSWQGDLKLFSIQVPYITEDIKPF